MRRRSIYTSPNFQDSKRAKFQQYAGATLGVITFFIAFFGLSQYAKAPLSPNNFSLPVVSAQSASKYTATPAWHSDVISAAISAKGEGTIASYHADTKRPTASIAKLISALAILEKHPLKPGEPGPKIPISHKDEVSYQKYLAKNGAVVPVTAGRSIHLRHALQAMLLPSANNIADTTAIWAFGSLANYREYAAAMVKRMKLENTTIGADASGFDPQTQSTAGDLLRLGEIVLDTPALAEITAQKEFTMPHVGTFPNYNQLVTHYGYNGLKPGNTDEAGGTLLFSKKILHEDRVMTIIGVILGTKSGNTPYQAAVDLTDTTIKTMKD